MFKSCPGDPNVQPDLRRSDHRRATEYKEQVDLNSKKILQETNQKLRRALMEAQL